MDSIPASPTEPCSHGERIRQGHTRARMAGLPPPGPAPFGYRRTKRGFAIDRATAPIVREFFDCFLLYGSLRGAVRHIAKKYNKRIAVATGRGWLTNPVYRGDLAYYTTDPPEIVRNTHKALLGRDEAAQIDRLLRRNRDLAPRSASAPRSLAGLVVCAACHGKLGVVSAKPHGNTSGYLYLRCASCPQVRPCGSVAYDRVLAATIATVCAELPIAVSGFSDTPLAAMKAAIQAEIARKQDILAQLEDLLAAGILDRPSANLRAYSVKTELAALEAQLERLPPPNLQAIAREISIPQFWFDLSESERRVYFREFLRAIYLVPDLSETPPDAPAGKTRGKRSPWQPIQLHLSLAPGLPVPPS